MRDNGVFFIERRFKCSSMLRGVHDTKKVKTADLVHPRLSENPCKQEESLNNHSSIHFSRRSVS